MDISIYPKIDKKELSTVISNSLFSQFTGGNRKKISEMTMYELATSIPDAIADDIMNQAHDIIVDFELVKNE